MANYYPSPDFSAADGVFTGDMEVGGDTVITGDLAAGTISAPKFTAALAGVVGAMTVATPARALDAAFQPSATRPVLCIYSVKIGTFTDTGIIELLSDAANPPTTSRGNFEVGSGAVAVVEGAGLLVYLVPPGHYVKLKTTDLGSGATFTLVTQTEITL